jgi:hypothetical protein
MYMVALARRFSGLALVALVLSASAAIAGCSSDADEGSNSSKVRLQGNVGGSSGSGTKTQTFGNISTTGGSLHVSAHELHAKGAPDAAGRDANVIVNGDGSFSLDVDRGARWVVTVDDAQGNSAIVTFGDGQSTIGVSADGEGGTVNIGNLKVVGGEARTDVQIDGKFGLESTLARADEVFKAANGAIIAAQEAVAEAQKAAQEALKAAEQAQNAAEEARKAAEEAAKKAGGAAGGGAGK